MAESKLPDKLELIWKFKTGGPVKSSAIVRDSHVYVGSDDGHVYALSLADGKLIWNFQADSAIEAPPCYAKDAVVVGSTAGTLYALQGKPTPLWEYKTGGKIVGSANVCQTNNQERPRIVVGSYDNKLHCVDAETGKAVWVFESESYINGAPAVSSGNVIFGGCDSKVYLVAAADGKLIQKIEGGAYVAGSVAADDPFRGQAFLGHYGNEVLCVDFNESKIVWTYKDRNFPYLSSPALTEKHVLIGGRDKRLHCLARDTGKQVWEFATGGNVDSSPVVCGDKVVVGSADGRLYVVRLNTGKELWSYEVGAAITASPAVADGMVVIGAHDGTVYAFGNKK